MCCRFSLSLWYGCFYEVLLCRSPTKRDLSVTSIILRQLDTILPSAHIFFLSHHPGYREGFLWKRGRDNGQFLSRKFILSEREGALKYFNKQDVSTLRRVTCTKRFRKYLTTVASCCLLLETTKARDPKAVMKIETLNATFQPAKIGNPCGLQITYLKDNSTRNIFVYHSDAKVHYCSHYSIYEPHVTFNYSLSWVRKSKCPSSSPIY